jgi:hypothetical protein
VGAFATVLYLDDLEVTSENPKRYRCFHSVIGRARIEKLLNPVASSGDQPQYLRAEVDLLDEDDEQHQRLEGEARSLLGQLVEAQEDADLKPRFTRQMLNTAEFSPVGFWNVLHNWQELLKVRQVDLLGGDDEEDVQRQFRVSEAKLRKSLSDDQKVYLQQYIQASSHKTRLELFCQQMREEIRSLAIMTMSRRLRLDSMMSS